MLSSCSQGDPFEPQFGGEDQNCFVAEHIKRAQKGMRGNHVSLQESWYVPAGAAWVRHTPKTTKDMRQEVKQVGRSLCLIGWEPFARGTGFLAETHRCGSSVQNDIAKEEIKKYRKEKDSRWRGCKPTPNKVEAFSSTELLGRCQFSPRNSQPLSPSAMWSVSSRFLVHCRDSQNIWSSTIEDYIFF